MKSTKTDRQKHLQPEPTYDEELCPVDSNQPNKQANRSTEVELPRRICACFWNKPGVLVHS